MEALCDEGMNIVEDERVVGCEAEVEPGPVLA
jgi:hypothetical protein